MFNQDKEKKEIHDSLSYIRKNYDELHTRLQKKQAEIVRMKVAFFNEIQNEIEKYKATEVLVSERDQQIEKVD